MIEDALCVFLFDFSETYYIDLRWRIWTTEIQQRTEPGLNFLVKLTILSLHLST